MPQPNAFAEYWGLVMRRQEQDMQKIRWGSEVEAQSGGSSASFRYSDPVSYVSRIMAEFPNSFIFSYPDETNAMRALHGLEPLYLTETQDDETKGTTASAGVEGDFKVENAVGGYGLDDLFQGDSQFGELFMDNETVRKWALILLALVLVFGGIIIVALSTDAGQKIAKTAIAA